MSAIVVELEAGQVADNDADIHDLQRLRSKKRGARNAMRIDSVMVMAAP